MITSATARQCYECPPASVFLVRSRARIGPLTECEHTERRLELAENLRPGHPITLATRHTITAIGMLRYRWMERLMYLLLVEDDPGVARVVTRALVDDGYRVDTVSNGPEALMRGVTEAFDLILLDILLPGMDGLSVCRALRQHQVRTPILMLTARDAVPDRVRGLDAGADDYLSKPFSLVELLARVRALLRRFGNGETNVLQVGDLLLDTSSHSVSRAGQSIELTGREFALLTFLMRHPNQVLTKEQLINHVWGYDSGVTDNVVEMYIHYLREKLDRDFARPLIRTVRGAGYLIRA